MPATGGPNVYPGVLSWLGVVRETVVGTPLVPVVTHPVDQGQFEPEDTPRFLDDKAIRGSMTDLFYKTLGVEQATFNFGGPNFLDSHGYFFDNVFGDLSTTGTTPANPATISGTVPIGSTSFTLAAAPPAAYTAGATIQIDTGSISEVVVIGSTQSSNIVNLAISSGGNPYPLRFPHATGKTVNTVTSPYTHKWASLNSQLGYGGAFGAQPPTHTFADVSNIVSVYTSATYGTAATNAFGARLYPSAVLKDITFSGNAEQLLGLRMTGDSWISVPSGTAVTNVTTNSRPIPNWNSTVVTGGYTITSANPYNGIGNFSISLKRGTQVYWTVQGTQQPYIIARGPLTMDGQLEWTPTNSETPLDLMLLNAQTPTTITVTNTGIPNAGTPFTLTFTASQLANVKSKIMRNGVLIGYSNSFEAVANSTDTGGSGGLGPATVTLVNNTAVYLQLVADYLEHRQATGDALPSPAFSVRPHRKQARMRIELVTKQDDGSGPHWIEVREKIKGGDIFAVHEANEVEIGDDGRPTRISFQKADDDALIALSQRVITGWSFQVPLPPSFAAMKSVLSDFDGDDLRKFRAEMRPLLDLVRNDGQPDPTKPEAGSSSS